MSELTVRVEAIVQEAVDIKLFRLVAVHGELLPTFAAGAHIDVHIAPGIVRQYSLCGEPSNCSQYLIAVKREAVSLGGSQALCDIITAGATLHISPPRNHFPLAQNANHHVLFGGGIGITPLLSMAQHLQATGASFELHYFARSPEHTAFRDLLDTGLVGHAKVYHGHDAGQVKGIAHTLLDRYSAGAHAYICGPRAFMELVQDCAGADWPPEAIHVEHFSADANCLAVAQGSFVIHLARSGGAYTVREDQTIVSALAEHEIYIDTSCEEGLCGTCTVDVLAGIPEHHDEVLTPAERSSYQKIVTCVSRAKGGALTLDL